MNKKLQRYKNIFSEYIVEHKTQGLDEHIYWKFPNNWGAWLYYKEASDEYYEINRNEDYQPVCFEDWLAESSFLPTMEIVPIRYSTSKGNEATVERSIAGTEIENIETIPMPDYESQDIIVFPFFDPTPVNVINLLTKISCLDEFE